MTDAVHSAPGQGPDPIVLERCSIAATTDSGRSLQLVHDISLRVARGQVLALIGESGSGKTTLSLSMMGYFRKGCHPSGGRILIGGQDLSAMSDAERNRLRGMRIAYVAQSAAAAFNPARRIMEQVTEIALIHRVMPRAAADAKAVALFGELGLPDPQRIGSRYPHQVSGGQLQRLAAAMAIIADPQIVIFDEPTTALDVTTQIGVLRAFKRVIRDKGMTGIYVSHDLAVVAQIADRIAVLKNGELQEEGSVDDILHRPTHPYTRELLAAFEPAPRRPATPVPAVTDADRHRAPVLEAVNLVAGYGAGAEFRPAIRNVSFRLPKGQSLGVIGESGSGKSTLARCLAGLLPLRSGGVILEGRELQPALGQRRKEDLRRMQIVFQMADTALNPAVSVAGILERPLVWFHGMDRKARQARVRDLLDMVRLPASVATRLPSELSGGQKQRVNFARALAANPQVILCDEITSALDTVVAAAVLELLGDLQRDLGVSYVFISHDLATVRSICDQVMVMQHGAVVDHFDGCDMTSAARHPYTRLLAASQPQLDTGWLDRLPDDILPAEGLR
ncbi:nickel import ATP-binding protein NikE [Paracoccus nototheniae]|uniref:ABC transporter ATP-binding protein n=1 Tax=Paracoccus nototheniae TaxID=2489002 RepID=UPI00103F1A2C|nr:ABC transporter ATP-binding protein [Paracoccus nototheniae]